MLRSVCLRCGSLDLVSCGRFGEFWQFWRGQGGFGKSRALRLDKFRHGSHGMLRSGLGGRSRFASIGLVSNGSCVTAWEVRLGVRR